MKRKHTIEMTFTAEAATALQAILYLRRAMSYLPESYVKMFDIKLSTTDAQPVQHADE
jgi:hypothetical protein